VSYYVCGYAAGYGDEAALEAHDGVKAISARENRLLRLVLRFFEMTLLDMLGYRPELGACIACGRPLEPVANAWAAGAGGVVCPNCQHDISGVRPLSVNALKLLRLFQGQHFAEVARVHVSPELAEELEGHLRDSIHHALERDVRSAHFVETLRRSHPAPAPPVDG
jgi:DNA repair protein RecO (recombination protein O)